VLFNITLHNLSVKGKRLCLCNVVGQLSFFGLNHVHIRDSYDVSEAIVSFFSLVLGLLGQESLLVKGAVDLLSETACGRFVLRWLPVELLHFVVKIVDCTIIAQCNLCGRYAALGAVISLGRGMWATTIFLEFFDLPLDIGDLFVKLFVFEQLVAQADTELGMQAQVKRCVLLRRRLCHFFGK
jgi:hypothetical protein